MNKFCNVCGGLNNDEINSLLECNRCLIKVLISFLDKLIKKILLFKILRTNYMVLCRCIRLVMGSQKFPKVIGVADHAGRMSIIWYVFYVVMKVES